MRFHYSLKALAFIGVLIFMAGCAGNPFGDAKVLPLNNAFRAGDVVPVNSHAPVRLALGDFTDERTGLGIREVGVMEKGIVVYGIKGPQLFADNTVAQIVSQALRRQFGAGGYQLVDVAEADFQVTGAIRDYQINIAARDKASMRVVMNLYSVKDRVLVWSGEISWQGERFAGVGGNSSKSITAFLSASLQKLMVKTYNAVTTGLMRGRADLFVDPAAVPASGGAVGIKTLALPKSVVPPIQPSAVTSKASPADLKLGRLAISTKPERAGVYVDEIYFGLTPIEIELAPGIHALRVVREGYRSVEQKVSVRKGTTTELPLTLAP
jgi:PEGA domain